MQARFQLLELERLDQVIVGTGGQTLDPLMPRYTLTTREVEALAAYLGSLGATPPPGITDEAIHLATVVAPDASPRRRQAMLDVLQHCVAEHGPRPGSERRPWRLHTWTLHGPPPTWPAQLARHLRGQPVFALLSGIGREWAPVHAFCEAEGLPCLFPNTDAPGPAPQSSIYLSPGVAVEGRVMARYLEDRPRPPRRLVQVFAADDIGRHGAAALAAELPTAGRLDLLPGTPLPPLAEGDALALWLPYGALRDFLARGDLPLSQQGDAQGIGADVMLGGLGNDLLNGGTEADTQTGGDGNDTFIAGTGDTILDFNAGNTGGISDGDLTNNDLVDLSSYYPTFSKWPAA